MNNLQISDNPEEVKSHYDRLSLPDKRGQARYRCKKCGYELICTGRGRLIVHIVGQLIPGTPQKQVKYCGNPDEGLKVALINYMKTDKFHSRLKFKTKRNLLKEVVPTRCPAAAVSEDSLHSDHSDSVLGKRSVGSSPSSEPPKKYQSISQDSDDESQSESPKINGIEEMQKEDLFGLVNILRLMDPGKFELALCINQPSSLSRQSIAPVPPMISPHYSSDSSFSLDDSLLLLHQHQLLLQSHKVLGSLGLGSCPPIHNPPPLPYNLNPLIAATVATTSSSLLCHPQLFSQVNHR